MVVLFINVHTRDQNPVAECREVRLLFEVLLIRDSEEDQGEYDNLHANLRTISLLVSSALRRFFKWQSGLVRLRICGPACEFNSSRDE